MEKLTFGNDPSEIHESSSLSYYGNDYYIAQHFGELFFLSFSCRVRFCDFNCFVALRPRFHAYVVSVYDFSFQRTPL